MDRIPCILPAEDCVFDLLQPADGYECWKPFSHLICALLEVKVMTMTHIHQSLHFSHGLYFRIAVTVELTPARVGKGPNLFPNARRLTSTCPTSQAFKLETVLKIEDGGGSRYTATVLHHSIGHS